MVYHVLVQISAELEVSLSSTSIPLTRSASRGLVKINLRLTEILVARKKTVCQCLLFSKVSTICSLLCTSCHAILVQVQGEGRG